MSYGHANTIATLLYDVKPSVAVVKNEKPTSRLALAGPVISLGPAEASEIYFVPPESTAKFYLLQGAGSLMVGGANDERDTVLASFKTAQTGEQGESTVGMELPIPPNSFFMILASSKPGEEVEFTSAPEAAGVVTLEDGEIGVPMSNGDQALMPYGFMALTSNAAQA